MLLSSDISTSVLQTLFPHDLFCQLEIWNLPVNSGCSLALVSDFVQISSYSVVEKFLSSVVEKLLSSLVENLLS